MREIKFRVWDKDDNKMFTLGDAIEKELVCYFIGDNDIQSQYDSVVLMQWTGFKDKQGVDIYEGDIVRFQSNIKEIPFNLPVKWSLCGWDPFNSYSDIFRNGYKPEDHLVIGNIYENPEIEYRKPSGDL